MYWQRATRQAAIAVRLASLFQGGTPRKIDRTGTPHARGHDENDERQRDEMESDDKEEK